MYVSLDEGFLGQVLGISHRTGHAITKRVNHALMLSKQSFKNVWVAGRAFGRRTFVIFGTGHLALIFTRFDNPERGILCTKFEILWACVALALANGERQGAPCAGCRGGPRDQSKGMAKSILRICHRMRPNGQRKGGRNCHKRSQRPQRARRQLKNPGRQPRNMRKTRKLPRSQQALWIVAVERKAWQLSGVGRTRSTSHWSTKRIVTRGTRTSECCDEP